MSSLDSLKKTSEASDKTLMRLQDYNSSSPEIRKFLQARGLTNVRELDKQGRADLIDHLVVAAGIHPS